MKTISYLCFMLISFLTLAGVVYGKTTIPTFKVGETLFYNIHVFGVKAGEQKTSVMAISNVAGIKSYHIKSRTYSTGMARKVYHLDDLFEVWLNYSNLQPVLVKRKVEEGKFRESITVHFDFQEMTCTTFSKRYKKVQ